MPNAVLIHHLTAQPVKISAAFYGLQNFVVCTHAAQGLTAILPFAVGDQLIVVDVDGHIKGLGEGGRFFHLQSGAVFYDLAVFFKALETESHLIGVLYSDTVHRDQPVQIGRCIFGAGDHRLSEVLDSQGLLCLSQLLLGGGEDKGITLF